MLVLLATLIITWIAHNWWKLLLLLIGVIILHEYQVRKYSKKPKDAGDTSEENTADKINEDPPL